MRAMKQWMGLAVAVSCLLVGSSALAQREGNQKRGDSVAQTAGQGVDVVIKVPANTEVYHNNRRVSPVPPAPPSPPPPPPAPPVVQKRSAPEPPPAPQKQVKKKKKKHHTVRVAFGLAMLPVHIDVALSKSFSLHTAFFYVYPGKGKSYYGGALAGIDYYFIGRAPEGLSLGMRLGHVGWGKKGGKKTGMFIARGVAGYKWIWSSGFTLNLGLGMQYIRKYKTHSDKKPVSYVLPHFEFGIGVAF